MELEPDADSASDGDAYNSSAEIGYESPMLPRTQAEEKAEREAKRQAKKKQADDNITKEWSRQRARRYQRVDILGIVLGTLRKTIKARAPLPDGYTGKCNMWMSLQKDGQVNISFAPQDWKGGAKFTTYDSMIMPDYYAGELLNKLTKKRQLADALEVAESGQFPEKKISRLEGILAANFFQVRNVAKAYLIHIGLLQTRVGIDIAWPVESQARGIAIFQGLQATYEPAAFESGEVVALAAGHLKSLPNLPDWFFSDPRYIDVYLWKFHARALKSDGPRAKRGILATYEFTPEFVPLDQQQFNNTLRIIGNGVVQQAMLNDLMNISPIAVKLLEVRADDTDSSVFPDGDWDPVFTSWR